MRRGLGEEIDAAWRRDPDVRAAPRWLVAVGNVSLLGLGYVLLGRRAVAGAAGVVTLLLLVLVVVSRSVIAEVAVVGWASTTAVHGAAWARRARGAPADVAWWAPTFLAAGAVLVVVVVLRIDGYGVRADLDDASALGDCPLVMSVAADVGAAHRLVTAPLTARVESAAVTCRAVDAIVSPLARAPSDDPTAAAAAVRRLSRIADEQPGHEAVIARALSPVLAGLRGPDPCGSVGVVDALLDLPPGDPPLDAAVSAARRVAPQVLIGCADAEMARAAPRSARAGYQRVVDQYPADPRAGAARAGVVRAGQAIELVAVRDAVARPAGQGGYCEDPVAYRAAPPFGPGLNRAVVVTEDLPARSIVDRAPPDWRTDDPAAATAVVCLGPTVFGAQVLSCAYVVAGAPPVAGEVAFHRMLLPARVHELRTGRTVAATGLDVGGTTCPGTIDPASPPAPARPGPGLPDRLYVEPSTAEVLDAFGPLVLR